MKAFASVFPLAGLLAGCTADRTSLGEPVGSTDGPGTTSPDDESSSGGMGSSDDPGTSDSSGGDEGEPSGCVPDAECPLLGTSCDAQEGDFSCECVCKCDEPNPSGPGFWECEYTHDDELVEVVGATVTFACEAGTIGSETEVVLHNAGSVEIQVSPSIYWNYDLVGPGGERADCGAYYCEEGDAICEAEPAALLPGEQTPWTQTYPASDCSQALTQKERCALCGGTASILIPWVVQGPDGFESSWSITVDGVAIDCV